MNPVPSNPLSENSQWADNLAQVAQSPLTMCSEFPRIAARHEAWWAAEVLDRPLFLAAANTNLRRPIRRRLELLAEPDQWLAAREADVRQLHYVGDSLPVLRVDFGPVLLAGFFGGSREIGSDTTWTHRFIKDDWSNAPTWTIPDDHPLWVRMRKRLDLAAQAAAGHFLVGSPDLGNPGDILLKLRGSTELCMDTIAQPEQIRQASTAILASWAKAYLTLYRDVLSRGAGLVHWLELWSNQPYDVQACDFNALISPQCFADLFLPDIARQARHAGHAVFHLDGPDATRHIDLLLEVPEIQAIQFTPGTGTPSALPWIAMFRKIQKQDRSLLVFCPAHEVLSLCEQLKPEGLAVRINDVQSPSDLDDLYDCFRKKF